MGTSRAVRVAVLSATTTAPALETARRILIGGPCAAIRTWLRMALASLGLDCDEADNGWELLVKIADGDYDLVVADQRMPGVSGADALTLLRQARCDTPFLLLAPACRDSVRAAAARAGNAFLVEDVLDGNAVRDAGRALIRFATRPG
jgi:CheY-like chemotaxis protein